ARPTPRLLPSNAAHHGKEKEDQKQKRIASLRSLGAKHGSALENVRARKTVEGGVGWMAGV
ncbi:hypothetical protein, partial [Stenotrophomonas maltophilia]|uniref:hypothetical protein n=1 Tax=Stenotrophomonas maltophilia TaxID=40324 RepID=UPI001A7E1A38